MRTRESVHLGGVGPHPAGGVDVIRGEAALRHRPGEAYITKLSVASVQGSVPPLPPSSAEDTGQTPVPTRAPPLVEYMAASALRSRSSGVSPFPADMTAPAASLFVNETPTTEKG